MRRKIRVKRYIRNDGRPVRGHTRYIATRRSRRQVVQHEYEQFSPRGQKYVLQFDVMDANVNDLARNQKENKRMAMKYPDLAMIGVENRSIQLMTELDKNLQLLEQVDASSLKTREKELLAVESAKISITALDILKSDIDIVKKAGRISAKDVKETKENIEKVQREGKYAIKKIENKHKVYK